MGGSENKSRVERVTKDVLCKKERVSDRFLKFLIFLGSEYASTSSYSNIASTFTFRFYFLWL